MQPKAASASSSREGLGIGVSFEDEASHPIVRWMSPDCMMLCLWDLADVTSFERFEFASLKRALALASEQYHVIRLGAESSHCNERTTLVLVSM